MQIAILLYDNYTALDVVGPYQTLSPLPGAETVFVAEEPGPVIDDYRILSLTAQKSLTEVTKPDIVIVPGSVDPDPSNEAILNWLRAVDATTTWTTSVCTGSLLLAAAGLLQGRRATSHWTALDRLAPYGAVPVDQRVVTDDKYVTAAGVSAGIDMGLTLAGKVAGDKHAQAVQLMIQYDPQPPYDAGSPHNAPVELVERLKGYTGFQQKS
ncbi:DJ-1/PfpI family protein [Streptomyces chartreusis]